MSAAAPILRSILWSTRACKYFNLCIIIESASTHCFRWYRMFSMWLFLLQAITFINDDPLPWRMYLSPSHNELICWSWCYMALSFHSCQLCDTCLFGGQCRHSICWPAYGHVPFQQEQLQRDHYYDVIMGTMASQLPSLTIVFTQSFIQAQIKENIKAPLHWPLCGEFTGERWIPRTTGQ